MKVNKTAEEYILKLFENKEYNIDNTGVIKNSKGEEVGSSSTGYKRFSVKRNKVYYSMAVNRIVYTIYKGPIPDDYVINHIDGNKLNNCITNLEAITESDNILHAFKTGLNVISEKARAVSSKRMNESNPAAKLNAEIADKIRADFKNGVSREDICKNYSIGKRSLYNILNNITYK